MIMCLTQDTETSATGVTSSAPGVESALSTAKGIRTLLAANDWASSIQSAAGVEQATFQPGATLGDSRGRRFLAWNEHGSLKYFPTDTGPTSRGHGCRSSCETVFVETSSSSYRFIGNSQKQNGIINGYAHKTE